ncbi:MAG: hypothetical protein PHI31_05860 [Desulfuromonadaceae bacterium]|nr:hypothetical protein [Desulfuromonadaceae bacterium]
MAGCPFEGVFWQSNKSDPIKISKTTPTMGGSKVKGLNGPGAGFLIKGYAHFVASGPDFDVLKAKFAWLRATMAVTIDSVAQTW